MKFNFLFVTKLNIMIFDEHKYINQFYIKYINNFIF